MLEIALDLNACLETLDSQAKRVDKLACQRVSADCSASFLRLAKQSASHNLAKGLARKEYKGFAMQPKSEWHEKAIRWFIKEMYKG